ncbi:cation-transporting P-type ATPase [Flavobacterium sp. LS2P90]|uniref:Cation-transporting P-type ATPase n=1 Tax=Flavobacterium xylosi TaxID=3230415 RepID=A0ABW6HRK2_9FLAO
MNWHVLTHSETAKLLNTTPTGIYHSTASLLLTEHGKNEIVNKKKKTILQMLLHQLLGFMIFILIIAAIISGILGDLTDAVIIIA